MNSTTIVVDDTNTSVTLSSGNNSSTNNSEEEGERWAPRATTPSPVAPGTRRATATTPALSAPTFPAAAISPSVQLPTTQPAKRGRGRPKAAHKTPQIAAPVPAEVMATYRRTPAPPYSAATDDDLEGRERKRARTAPSPPMATVVVPPQTSSTVDSSARALTRPPAFTSPSPSPSLSPALAHRLPYNNIAPSPPVMAHPYHPPQRAGAPVPALASSPALSLPSTAEMSDAAVAHPSQVSKILVLLYEVERQLSEQRHLQLSLEFQATRDRTALLENALSSFSSSLNKMVAQLHQDLMIGSVAAPSSGPSKPPSSQQLQEQQQPASGSSEAEVDPELANAVTSRRLELENDMEMANQRVSQLLSQRDFLCTLLQTGPAAVMDAPIPAISDSGPQSIARDHVESIISKWKDNSLAWKNGSLKRKNSSVASPAGNGRAATDVLAETSAFKEFMKTGSTPRTAEREPKSKRGDAVDDAADEEVIKNLTKALRDRIRFELFPLKRFPKSIDWIPYYISVFGPNFSKNKYLEKVKYRIRGSYGNWRHHLLNTIHDLAKSKWIRMCSALTTEEIRRKVLSRGESVGSLDIQAKSDGSTYVSKNLMKQVIPRGYQEVSVSDQEAVSIWKHHFWDLYSTNADEQDYEDQPRGGMDVASNGTSSSGNNNNVPAKNYPKLGQGHVALIQMFIWEYFKFFANSQDTFPVGLSTQRLEMLYAELPDSPSIRNMLAEADKLTSGESSNDISSIAPGESSE